MTCFDILNIEYNEEGYLLDFSLPDTMRICVKEGDNWSHTEEAIRKQINNMEELYANDVKVVDFTAFYEGTDKPLRGNYEDYEAETFEAREKKIGSIRIVKNPNFPSGTSLQAYIKTNRGELRKVFGNPNMGESGDGKSKGKEWNLIVGPHRVTIYDRREMDKKGTKYFNIGGDGKYGALLVAQALSIHRNEKVHAIEISPAWDKEKFDYARGMKFPDSHDILTYERAKEYEDNRRRYRAETFEADFKPTRYKKKGWVITRNYEDYMEATKGNRHIQIHYNKGDYEPYMMYRTTGSGEYSFKTLNNALDWLNVDYPLYEGGKDFRNAESFEAEPNFIRFLAFKKDAWGFTRPTWYLTKKDAIQAGENPNDIYEHDLDKEQWEWFIVKNKLREKYANLRLNPDSNDTDPYEINRKNLQNYFIEQEINWENADDIRQTIVDFDLTESYPSADLILNDEGSMKAFMDSLNKNLSAENLEAEDDLTFKEWADQEMMTHGGRESFDDWLDDELESHGDNITLQDWGHHELDSHYERYGAEEYDHVATLRKFVAWLKKNNLEPSDVMGFTPDGQVLLKPKTQRANYKPDVMFIAENWGGDPEGKLALALQKAREKAKKPKKPLKIEKLGAEDNIKRFKVGEQYTHRYYHGYGFSDYEVMRRTDKSVWFSKVNPETGKVDSPLLVSRHKLHTMQPFEHDGEIIDGLEMVRLQMGYPVKAGQTTMSKYAETSGQWEIGEQLEEAQMNAEGGGRFDQEGGKMVSIYYQTIVDYTWRTDPDDANVDEWRVQDEVEDKIKDEMHIGDSSYGTFYAYDNETHESVEVSYSWDKTIEEDDEEIIKSWAETDESLQAEGKKRKRISGALSDPFDELSLDSGGIKSIVVGIGIGLLACVGYNKWK